MKPARRLPKNPISSRATHLLNLRRYAARCVSTAYRRAPAYVIRFHVRQAARRLAEARAALPALPPARRNDYGHLIEDQRARDARMSVHELARASLEYHRYRAAANHDLYPAFPLDRQARESWLQPTQSPP